MEITIRPALWRTRWMILLYMLIIAGAAWWWRRWFLKRQQQRMDAETLRRETEKQHWMREMRQEMVRKNGQAGNVEAVEEPQHEQVVLNRKEEDLVVVVKGICKTFAATKEGQKAKISCRSMTDELKALIDHDQLTTALNILLHNSVRFSPGNCQITVNLGKSDQRHAVIQVGDNGIGIRDEYKATAFEPMIGNEGIGLDKVKDIVVAHEGSIRLEDNPGGGTVVVITLPIEPEVEIEEAVLMDEE